MVGLLGCCGFNCGKQVNRLTCILFYWSHAKKFRTAEGSSQSPIERPREFEYRNVPRTFARTETSITEFVVMPQRTAADPCFKITKTTRTAQKGVRVILDSTTTRRSLRLKLLLGWCISCYFFVAIELLVRLWINNEHANFGCSCYVCRQLLSLVCGVGIK